MKYNKAITLSFFFVLMMMFSVLTTTIKASPQVTTITYWYTENDSEKPGVLDLIDEFNAANPDIEVEALQKGFFDARTLYTNAFIAATEPELFRAARDWVPEFAVAGMIAPLTDEFTQAELDDFLPSAVRLVTYPDSYDNDQIWGYPQLIDTPALMYNKYIFEDAGINTSKLSVNTSWTWDEFVGNASQIVDHYTTDNVTSIHALTIAGMFFGAQSIYFGQGALLFNDGIVDANHIGIDTPEARSALKFLKDLIEVHKLTPPWEEMGWETLNVLFANEGKVAMIQQGPWELKNFLDNSPEFNPTVDDAKPYASADNLGIMQLPHDEAGNQGAPLGGHALVVSAFASGAKYEAAIKLAKFLTSEESMAHDAIEYYHVPARASVMEREDVKAAPTYEYVLGFKKNVDKAYQVPVDHRWATIEQRFADNIDEYLADDITLEVCILETIAEWKDILTQEATGSLASSTTLPEETPGIGLITALAAIPILIRIRKKSKR
jgi:arabinogalactan oligomer/maltooligosaccharide transport system substrate-binding protein